MTAHPNPPVPEACEPIHYTAREFLACRRELRDILIAPFDESKCKGIGYNISPSELCYSVKKKHLLQIHRTEQEIYVLIPPHDTSLHCPMSIFRLAQRSLDAFCHVYIL